MPHFVPVHDTERPRCEQKDDDPDLQVHRRWDTPHALNRPKRPGGDESKKQIAVHSTGGGGMVRNEKGLWVPAARAESERRRLVQKEIAEAKKWALAEEEFGDINSDKSRTDPRDKLLHKKTDANQSNFISNFHHDSSRQGKGSGLKGSKITGDREEGRRSDDRSNDTRKYEKRSRSRSFENGRMRGDRMARFDDRDYKCTSINRSDRYSKDGYNYCNQYDSSRSNDRHRKEERNRSSHRPHENASADDPFDYVTPKQKKLLSQQKH